VVALAVPPPIRSQRHLVGFDLDPRGGHRAADRGDAVRRLCWLVVVALVFAVGAARGSDLTILYTNDLHARLGQLESLAALVGQERQEGKPVLLLDAGDTWQDFRTPLPVVWGAEETVAWMNEVGYSAMALGNHDLYFGAEHLASLAAKASFPVLCANLIPLGGWKAPFVSWTLVPCGDLRVLVVGLTTGELLPYADFPWLRYEEPARALADALEAAADEPRDLVVAVCHLPVNQARRLAEVVPGVDLFVTGHSHDETPQPVRVGDVLIVQARPFGQALGRLRLDVDQEARAVRLVDNALLTADTRPVATTPGLLRLFQVVILTGLLIFLLLA